MSTDMCPHSLVTERTTRATSHAPESTAIWAPRTELSADGPRGLKSP